MQYSTEVWLGRTESEWFVTHEDGSEVRFDNYAQEQLNDAFSAQAEVKALRKVIGELEELTRSALEEGYDHCDFELGVHSAYQRVARVLKG